MTARAGEGRHEPGGDAHGPRDGRRARAAHRRAAAPPAARRAAADRRLAVRRRAVHGRRARLRPARRPVRALRSRLPDQPRPAVPGARSRSRRRSTPTSSCPTSEREEFTRGSRTIERATSIPQLVVPNVATVALLGRLGRRLAYLPTDGERPADPALVRLGRHLSFVRRRAQFTGQQLIVAAGELLSSHWQTGMSSYEAASLAALDAWIDPPTGVHAFDAAARGRGDRRRPAARPRRGRDRRPARRRLQRGARRQRRSGGRGAAARRPARPLRRPDRRHLGPHPPLSSTASAGGRRPPSVERRFTVDRDEYTRHMEWMNHPSGGRRRARMTARQTAQELHALERRRRPHRRPRRPSTTRSG